MAAETQRSGGRSPEPPPQVTMGLLDYITSTSLDQDYAHVSRSRAEAGQTVKGRPGRAGLVVLVVFGVLVATAAVETSRTAAESASSRSSLIKQANEHKTQLDKSLSRVRTLRREVSSLQARELIATREGRAVEQQLNTLGVASGARAAHGPGIQVVVDDAPHATSFKQKVQAPDLQKLVNGLWQVGAEAVSINGQRLTNLSSIRDAGSAITVNYVSLRPPYKVSAIGDPKTMGARLLDTPGGQALLTLQSTFGLQLDINSKDSMVLPAAKRVTLRSAREEPSQKTRRSALSGGAG